MVTPFLFSEHRLAFLEGNVKQPYNPKRPWEPIIVNYDNEKDGTSAPESSPKYDLRREQSIATSAGGTRKKTEKVLSPES